VETTDKRTPDWYIKWTASIIIIASMSVRGIDGYQLLDISLSTAGVGLWLVVSLMWNDRALIVVNGVGLMLLLRNLANILLA
tara:strand:- start:257 stop:502 length:246 start_codon:yes stop_codon:yes gene_type:complete